MPEPRFLLLPLPLALLLYLTTPYPQVLQINCPPPNHCVVPTLSVPPTVIFPDKFCATFRVSFLPCGPSWSPPAPLTPEGLDSSGILPNSYLLFKTSSRAAHSRRITNQNTASFSFPASNPVLNPGGKYLCQIDKPLCHHCCLHLWIS